MDVLTVTVPLAPTMLAAAGLCAGVGWVCWRQGRRALRRQQRASERARARAAARAARFAEVRVATAQYAAGAGIVPTPMVRQAERDAAMVLTSVTDTQTPEPEPMYGVGDPGDLPPRVEARYLWPSEPAPRQHWSQPTGWLR